MDVTKLTQLHDRLSKELGGTDVWRPKAGTNIIRILPPKVGDKFYLELAKHWVPQTGKRDNTPVFCGRSFEGLVKCDLCDLMEELQEDPKTAALAADLRPKHTYFVLIIDKDEERLGVQVAELGKSTFNQVIGIMLDPQYGDVTHPSKGFDLTITKSGRGIYNTKYEVRSHRLESEVKFREEDLLDISTIFKPPLGEFIEGVLEKLDIPIETGDDRIEEEREEPETKESAPAPVNRSLKAKLSQFRSR